MLPGGSVIRSLLCLTTLALAAIPGLLLLLLYDRWGLPEDGPA